MLDVVEYILNIGWTVFAALFLLLWIGGIICAGITSVYVVILIGG